MTSNPQNQNRRTPALTHDVESPNTGTDFINHTQTSALTRANVDPPEAPTPIAKTTAAILGKHFFFIFYFFLFLFFF
jgi:hypothetical protein